MGEIPTTTNVVKLFLKTWKLEVFDQIYVWEIKQHNLVRKPEIWVCKIYPPDKDWYLENPVNYMVNVFLYFKAYFTFVLNLYLFSSMPIWYKVLFCHSN